MFVFSDSVCSTRVGSVKKTDTTCNSIVHYRLARDLLTAPPAYLVEVVHVQLSNKRLHLAMFEIVFQDVFKRFDVFDDEAAM